LAIRVAAVPEPGCVSSAVETESRPAGTEPGRVRLHWPGPDSVWWLALVAAAFCLAQLVFVVPRLGLSWDEVVYVSQVSGHAPAAYFDPARARGIPLLVAPVTLLTSSVLALRCYLAVASGLGLFLSLAAWRYLRPAWLLAMAGVFFAGLWTTQYYGPQAMPDEWVAFSALAAVGLFLQAVRHGQPQRLPLAGLAFCLAVAALVRPGDALYLAAALVIAVLAVRQWRHWSLLAAVILGFAAGAAQWVAEAFLRFGGPLRRLHAAAAEQGGFGFHLAIWDELRALNGPTLCRPCTVGLRYPEISLWWLALPVLALLGFLAARRAGQLGSSVLAAGCGLSLALQYLILVSYAAPRFLLPSYALAAIPVADAVSWLATGLRGRTRLAAVTALAAGVVAQLLVQNAVLRHQVDEKIAFFDDYSRIAADLRRLGVRPPCLVKGEQNIPVAFYAGCASAPSVLAGRAAAEPVVVLVRPGSGPPGYAASWTRHRLPGVRTSLLRLFAYTAPRR
jgi:hypothetical protein